MFESITFEILMKEMLAMAPDDIDKREGSILYNALAPVAVELQNAYIQLDMILNQTFADTAEYEYLDMRCAERGINRRPATKAILKGVFNMDIPTGARFSLNTLYYSAVGKITDGVYKLECETAGREGNQHFGKLIPVTYIKGLTSASLTELLIPGEDQENDENLRIRYFSSLSSQSYGGNVADYKEKVLAVSGVGSVKVYPVWNGGGTVKLVIASSEYGVPAKELKDTVQTFIDPVQNQGKGLGIAPIGHIVTVEGVQAETVDFESVITYRTGWSFSAAKSYIEEIIDAYFLELSKGWAEADALIVRISQLESRILELEGVLDIGNTKLNGETANFILRADSIPVRGRVVG